MTTGRKPAPKALKLLKGDTRGINIHEPNSGNLQKSTPAPEWLSRTAQRIWQEHLAVAPDGVLQRLDSDPFAIYCQALANIQDFSAEYRNTRDKDLKHLLQEANKVVLRLAPEFGFTPSSRTRLQVMPSQNAKSAEEDVLSKIGV